MRGMGRRAIIAGSTALVLAAGAGVATAAISSSTGLVTAVSSSMGHVDSVVIHGCWTNMERHGSHAFVLLKAGASCPKGTTMVSWNQQGPAGRSVLATLSGPARKVTSLNRLNGIRCEGGAGITKLTHRNRESVTISCAVTRTQPTSTFTENWHTSPVSAIRTTPCPCGTTTGPAHSAPPTTTPPSTVTPYPDNTSADPVELGTVAITQSASDDDCGNITDPPDSVGYNATGGQAWYEFTTDAYSLAYCGTLEDVIEVTPDPLIGSPADTGGYFGIAATAAGVTPDTPLGTIYYLSLPATGGTFYIEVTGTGYFSVDV
jgi:hypothetical protein